MRWAGYVACVGEEINAYRVLVGKYEDRRPVGKCNHRWANSIKIDLKTKGETAWTRLIWLRIGIIGRLL
jgi:hypothetical protein